MTDQKPSPRTKTIHEVTEEYKKSERIVYQDEEDRVHPATADVGCGSGAAPSQPPPPGPEPGGGLKTPTSLTASSASPGTVGPASLTSSPPKGQALSGSSDCPAVSASDARDVAPAPRDAAGARRTAGNAGARDPSPPVTPNHDDIVVGPKAGGSACGNASRGLKESPSSSKFDYFVIPMANGPDVPSISVRDAAEAEAAATADQTSIRGRSTRSPKGPARTNGQGTGRSTATNDGLSGSKAAESALGRGIADDHPPCAATAGGGPPSRSPGPGGKVVAVEGERGRCRTDKSLPATATAYTAAATVGNATSSRSPGSDGRAAADGERWRSRNNDDAPLDAAASDRASRSTSRRRLCELYGPSGADYPPSSERETGRIRQVPLKSSPPQPPATPPPAYERTGAAQGGYSSTPVSGRRPFDPTPEPSSLRPAKSSDKQRRTRQHDFNSSSVFPAAAVAARPASYANDAESFFTTPRRAAYERAVDLDYFESETASPRPPRVTPTRGRSGLLSDWTRDMQQAHRGVEPDGFRRPLAESYYPRRSFSTTWCGSTSSEYGMEYDFLSEQASVRRLAGIAPPPPPLPPPPLFYRSSSWVAPTAAAAAYGVLPQPVWLDSFYSETQETSKSSVSRSLSRKLV